MRNLLVTCLLILALPAAAQERTVNRTHHLACLSEGTAHVQQLLARAEQSKRGVILYFHGGLSSQKYMEDVLGPGLERSLFADPALDGYLPIFVNYEAGFLEVLLEGFREFNSDPDIKRATEEFASAIDSTEMVDTREQLPAESRARAEADAMQQARNYLSTARTRTYQENSKFVEQAESDEEFYVRILQDPVLAQEVNRTLIETYPEFARTDSNLKSFTARELSPEAGTRLVLTIARSLARIALRSNHQIVPTFIEEALRELHLYGIGPRKLAVDHWRKVKEHARDCLDSDKPGGEFVDALLEIQSRRKGYEIHAVAHSTGAIPVGYLIERYETQGAGLNSAHLIAPAANLTLFRDLYLAHRRTDDQWRFYVLSGVREATDRLDVKKVTVYPASLLFFVSGVAEDAWYGDRMLLIDQHLQSSRRPYRSGLYQRIVSEDPQPVWDYFADNDELVVYDGEPIGPPYRLTATHECTKYPWVSQGIGRAIVQEISGTPSNGIPIPRGTKAFEAARAACGGL